MKCTHCEKELVNYQKKFCSRSCSASYNNSSTQFPKKIKISITKKCVNCSNTVEYNASKFCHSCIDLGWHTTFPKLPYSLRTLKYELEQCKHSGANKFNKIRAWARHNNKVYLKKCQRCGYNKHVEVCHKIPISRFSNETLLTEINSLNNLLFLCPNCHWEHDQI